jgi:hypothetical protein
MKNDAKSNNRQDDRNFQDSQKGIDSEESKSNEEPNKDLCLVNKGFPHYDKKNNSNADDTWSNYDDDKKNSEQEGYGEDTDSDSDLDKSQNNSKYDIKNVDKKGVAVDTDMGQMVIEQNPTRNE